MKNIDVKIILFCFSLTLFNFVESNSQWQSDVRLTNDPAVSSTSQNNAWCIASNGQTVHIVWLDDRNGNFEIYYKRSTDGGVSWEMDTRLTINPFHSAVPSISVMGTSVHCVWIENRDGNNEIYYKRSLDEGTTWGNDIRLTNNSGSSVYPSMSVSGQYVHISWADNRDGNFEIYYKFSTDGGTNWSADVRLTNSFADSEYPCIKLSGTNVHIVWHDERDGNQEIYYKRSSNEGVSWGVDLRLTTDTSFSRYSSLSISGPNLHVVWFDARDGNSEIYYKRSTNSGDNWGADTRLTNDTSFSWYPSISVSNSHVHIVWQDIRNGSFGIYYKHSVDGGISWGNDTRITSISSSSFWPSIVISGVVLHVLWYDHRDGNTEIYYNRNPTGNVVGLEKISTEIPNTFSLSQNFPNPFNPSTKIKFAIPKSSFTEMNIYDVLGRQVRSLINEELKAGIYEAEFNAADFPSGVYFYRITAGEFSVTKKMILIK